MIDVMIDDIWLLAPTVALRRLRVMAPNEGTVPVTPRKLEKKLAVPVRRDQTKVSATALDSVLTKRHQLPVWTDCIAEPGGILFGCNDRIDVSPIAKNVGVLG